MKILFTGGSSFTGYHLVKGLLAQHDLMCTFRQQPDEYEGIYRKRVGEIYAHTQPIHGAFGSENFLEAIAEADLIFHHGACVQGYASASFPEEQAVAQNTFNLDVVMQQAGRYSCPVVLTQSIFERAAFSPYSRSKRRTTEAFVSSALEHGVSLKRLVVPNPVGVMCNEKLLLYLMRCWSQGQAVFIRNPSLIRDNLPVDLLTKSVLSWLENEQELLQPSGYCGTNRFWVEFFASECRKRCQFTTKIMFNNRTNDDKQLDEPERLCNVENCFEQFPAWNEELFWTELIEHLLSRVSD